MKRLLALLLFSAALVSAQALVVVPLADLAGDGNVHQFSSSVSGAVAVYVQVVCTGTGTVRLGSSTVAPASNIGIPCAAGGAYFYQTVPMGNGNFRRYDLSTLLYLAPSGATVSISYAR
jgi:hypothetical protein